MVCEGEPSKNRRQVCLSRKSAFLKNDFCDLDLWTNDLENLIGSWPDYRKYLCK